MGHNTPMIRLLHKIPRKINLAFSGGIDSLAAAHFLSKNHEIHLMHFHHGNDYSDWMADECVSRAKELGLSITVGKIDMSGYSSKQSIEDYWRRQRYSFLRKSGERFITCHHLDDAAETYVFSSLHGTPKLIPSYDAQVIRPFIVTEKKDLTAYAESRKLVPVIDPSNADDSMMRNYIRKHIMPHAYHVNPGLNKVIRKKYLKGEDRHEG